MTISNNLFQAILAMDSYNRGYNQGIYIDDIPGESAIGNATVIQESNVAPGSSQVEASFFAAAYAAGNDIYISYRGTDDLSLFTGDILSGWPGALGSLSLEAAYAIGFYNQIVDAVTTDTVYSSPTFSLTGHSLGGGLAGLVAAIYANTAVVFDNMPYRQAAEDTYDYAVHSYNGDPSYVPGFSTEVYGLATPWAPDFSGITGYAVTGEPLGYLRALYPASMTPVSLGNTYSNMGVSPTQSHSQALLVTLLYGETQYASEVGSATNWESTFQYFIPELFRDDIAEYAGFSKDTGAGGTGTDDPGSQMLTAIAYSALDEGGLPFGNEGIRALFDDASDLSIFYDNLANTALAGKEAPLADLAISYAGSLALAGVADAPELRAGVLDVNDENTIFSVSSNGWVDWGLKGLVGSDFTALGFDDSNTNNTLSDFSLNEASSDYVPDQAALDALGAMGWTEGGDFYRFNFLLSTHNNFVLKEPAADDVSLTVGGSADETVYGSSAGFEVIALGAGDDTLAGGGGYYNILLGGTGTDAADYSTVFGGGINVSFVNYTGVPVIYYGGGTSADLLADVERVVGTDYGDTVQLGNFGVADSFDYIDGAGNASSPDLGDTVNASGLSAAATINLGNSLNQSAFLSSNVGEGVIHLKNFEDVIATSYDDTIFGNENGGYIIGLAGNDTIYGSEGSDYIFGNTINPLYDGHSDNDYIEGGGGNDYLVGSRTLKGGAGDDVYEIRRGFYTPVISFGVGDGHDTAIGDNGSNFQLDMSTVSSNDVSAIWSPIGTLTPYDGDASYEYYSDIGDLVIIITSTGDSIFMGPFEMDFRVPTGTLENGSYLEGPVDALQIHFSEGYGYVGGEGGWVPVYLGDTGSYFNEGNIDLDAISAYESSSTLDENGQSMMAIAPDGFGGALAGASASRLAEAIVQFDSSAGEAPTLYPIVTKQLDAINSPTTLAKRELLYA